MSRTGAKKLKQFPVFKTDEEAERFVDEADLSEYDLSGGMPLSEFMARRRAGRPPLGDKAKQHVSLRLDADVIAKFKATGKGWQGRINDALRDVLAISATPGRPVAFANRATKAAARPAAKATVRPVTKAAAKPGAKPRARSAGKSGRGTKS